MVPNEQLKQFVTILIKSNSETRVFRKRKGRNENEKELRIFYGLIEKINVHREG